MQFQSNSMYNNNNNNNKGNDDQRLQQPKPVSKLNKLRTNSYVALENEVEALRAKLGSKKQNLSASNYNSNNFKDKAANDIKKILESD